MELETPPPPTPPFMEKSILNFHFDYWNTSLMRRALIILIVFSRGTDNLSSFLLSKDDMKQWEVFKIDHNMRTYISGTVNDYQTREWRLNL